MDIHFHPDRIAADCYVAPNATLFGDVVVGEWSTLLFGAVVRGDADAIRIGTHTNIQDLVCLHGDPGFPCIIGNRVTVGHGAIVHGATVDDDCLIGIRATILNGAMIGSGSIIAAGALVPEGKRIPPRSVVMGIPGKVVRESSEADWDMIQHGWQHYVELNRLLRNA